MRGAIVGRCTARGLSRVTREAQDVIVLGGRQLKRPGKRIDHLPRGPDFPPLLQPGVPGEADAGEERDLLASEARRPPIPRGDESNRLRRNLMPPGLEEIRKLVVRRLAYHRLSVARMTVQ